MIIASKTYSLIIWGCLKSLRFWISLRIFPTTSRLRIFCRFRIFTATLCPVNSCLPTARNKEVFSHSFQLFCRDINFPILTIAQKHKLRFHISPLSLGRLKIRLHVISYALLQFIPQFCHWKMNGIWKKNVKPHPLKSCSMTTFRATANKQSISQNTHHPCSLGRPFCLPVWGIPSFCLTW